MAQVLSVHVWPTYAGVSTGPPGDPNITDVAENEPYDDFDYQRGQITWKHVPDADPLGYARIFCPKGVYTHVVWFRGPHREAFQGFDAMAHPLVFDRPGIFDLNPIRNESVVERQDF